MTLNADSPINVTLTANQWNTLLVQLAEGPYRLMAPLVNLIQQQCLEQDPDNLPQPQAPHRLNGGADPHPDP